VNQFIILIHQYGHNTVLDEVNGYNSLHLAVINGKLEIVNALLNAYVDIDVNSFTGNGDTPLILAVKNPNLEIVKALMKRGANHTLVNNEFKTAFVIALELMIDENIIHLFPELDESNLGKSAEIKKKD